MAGAQKRLMKTVVFDAYGTLWNIQAIERAVKEASGTSRSGVVLDLWRKKQLEYAWLRTLMDRYEPFFRVTQDALDYALSASGLQVNAERRRALMESWNRPEPYAESPGVLDRLKGPFYRAVLSNGDPAMLEAGLLHSQLSDRLDAVLSVDAVRRYKPHPAAYQWVLDALAVHRDDVVFISSNGWDVSGAAHFGFRVIWVNRAGGPQDVLGVDPWAAVSTLESAADKLLQL